MTKYKVVIKEKKEIFFDTLELTDEQVAKLKKDPNLLSIEKVLRDIPENDSNLQKNRKEKKEGEQPEQSKK